MARGKGEESGYRGASPPPSAPPTWQRRLFIDRRVDLPAIAAELADAHVVAIDAEFVQARVRSPSDPTHRLALLQLAIDNNYRASYVVDALRLNDLSPLQPALKNGAILKLFHGISADARVLATRGLYAHHTLDLEAVSRSIFGQRESGLQAMLQRACGVRLDKSLQRSNWARRPLTPAMVAYAARDAEMTYALYGWLSAHYPWAVALQETPAAPTPTPIAAWISPILESGRLGPVEQALADAGLMRDFETQARDLRQALAAVPHPHQRVRVMRLITDLDLVRLAPDLRPYLTARAAEERAGAARALGRLRDWQSQEALQALLEDPVEDVRLAAQIALEFMKGSSAPAPRRDSRLASGGALGPRTWIVEGGSEPDVAPEPDDWRAALRARFGETAVTEASQEATEEMTEEMTLETPQAAALSEDFQGAAKPAPETGDETDKPAPGSDVQEPPDGE
jgi:hypothetical protein